MKTCNECYSAVPEQVEVCHACGRRIIGRPCPECAEAAYLCDVQVPFGDMRSMKERALEHWEDETGEMPAQSRAAAK